MPKEQQAWFKIHCFGNLTPPESNSSSLPFGKASDKPNDKNPKNGFDIIKLLPKLLEDQSITEIGLPPSFFLHPISWVFFFRQVKKCTIFIWMNSQADNQANYNVPFFLIPLAVLLLKKPGGPSLLVVSKKEAKVTLSGLILNLLSDIKFTFTEELNPEQIRIDLHRALKEAFFAAECGHPSSIYKERIQKERIQWLKKQSQGTLLEIGCSTGFVLDFVGGGTGIDIDFLRLEYAKKTYPNWKFLNLDAAQMPFNDQEFDTVLIPDILEHVPFDHAQRIVNEAKRVSKRLVITVPNAEKPNYRKDLVENPDHIWFPKVSDVKILLGPKSQIQFSRNLDFIYGIIES